MCRSSQGIPEAQSHSFQKQVTSGKHPKRCLLLTQARSGLLTSPPFLWLWLIQQDLLYKHRCSEILGTQDSFSLSSLSRGLQHAQISFFLCRAQPCSNPTAFTCHVCLWSAVCICLWKTLPCPNSVSLIFLTVIIKSDPPSALSTTENVAFQ